MISHNQLKRKRIVPPTAYALKIISEKAANILQNKA